MFTIYFVSNAKQNVRVCNKTAVFNIGHGESHRRKETKIVSILYAVTDVILCKINL